MRSNNYLFGAIKSLDINQTTASSLFHSSFEEVVLIEQIDKDTARPWRAYSPSTYSRLVCAVFSKLDCLELLQHST